MRQTRQPQQIQSNDNKRLSSRNERSDVERLHCSTNKINGSRDLTSLDSNSRRQNVHIRKHDPSEPFRDAECAASISSDADLPQNSADGSEPTLQVIQDEVSIFQLQREQLKRLQLVASQAFLYVGASMLVTIWTIVFRIWESQTDIAPSHENDFYPVLVLQSIFLPLQGFFNLFIYTRPRYMKIRNDVPNESKIWAFRRALIGDDIQPKHRPGHVCLVDVNEHQMICNDEGFHVDNNVSSSKQEELNPEPLQNSIKDCQAAQSANGLECSERFPRLTLSSITASHGGFADQGSKLSSDKWEDRFEDTEVPPLFQNHQLQQQPPQRLKRSSSIEGASLEAISELTASYVDTMGDDLNCVNRISYGVDVSEKSHECDITVRSTESSHEKRVRFQEIVKCEPTLCAGRLSSSGNISPPKLPLDAVGVKFRFPGFDRMKAGSTTQMDTPIQAPKRRLGPPIA